MTAALLFAATFAAVCTLGLQQINVERRWMIAAAATSPLIGLAHLALFKVLPGPTDALEIAETVNAFEGTADLTEQHDILRVRYLTT